MKMPLAGRLAPTHLAAICILLFTSASVCGAQQVPFAESDSVRRREIKDSLKVALSGVGDYQTKVKMLYDLIDLSDSDKDVDETSDFYIACKQLYTLAAAHKDESRELDALAHMCTSPVDSISHSLAIASSLPATDEQKGTVAYMKYENTIRTISNQSDSGTYALLVNMIGEYRKADENDVYNRLELLSSLCNIMSHVTTDDLYISYLEQLGTLIESLPEKGKSYFPNAYYVLLANAYSRKGMYREALQAERKLQMFLDELESGHRAEGRRYSSMAYYRYVSCRRMLLCADVLSQSSIDSIYHRMEEYSKTSEVLGGDFNGKKSIAKTRYLMATKRYAEVVPILDGVLADGNHWWQNEALKDRIIAGKALKQNDPEFSKYALLYIDRLEKQQVADIANKAKELQIVYDVNDLEKQVSDLELDKDRAQIRRSGFIIIASLTALLILAWLLIYVIKSREKLAKTNKELEEARKKAEFASSMKTMFVENMNHEIRTPLNALVGFSEVIANDDGSMGMEEKRSYSKIISENSDMLLAMVSDLLDISDMESGQMTFKSEPCSLNEVCGSAAATYRSRVPERVALVFKPHENDLVIRTDRQRLSQVMRNYISNAVKNTAEGSITVDYADDPQARKVTLSVTDTGCGVPPDKAKEIFNRFEKLDNFKEGSGLGLNICEMIADGLKAEARLDTSYTGGARFLFILPY
jgi:signal transduction histidine kinase